MSIENEATRLHGCKVLKEGNIRHRRAMISGRYRSKYWRENLDPSLHTSHPLFFHEDSDNYIIVKMKRPIKTKSMLIDLPAIDSFQWDYKVDISTDGMRWQRLADCQNCFGSQLLQFDVQTIRYGSLYIPTNKQILPFLLSQVKITGYNATSATPNFFVLNFECPANEITEEQRQQLLQHGNKTPICLIEKDKKVASEYNQMISAHNFSKWPNIGKVLTRFKSIKK